MIDPIKIAIDAMGGENSPTKIIKGIEIHSLGTKNVFYNIFGDQNGKLQEYETRGDQGISE